MDITVPRSWSSLVSSASAAPCMFSEDAAALPTGLSRASCHSQRSPYCGKLLVRCTPRIVHEYRGSWEGMLILCIELEVGDALGPFSISVLERA